MKRVELSLNSYLGFWYNLTLHVDPDTCILYKTNDSNKKVPCTSITDLVHITGATISSFYRFYREASAKKYIASINFNVKNKYYILNPMFVSNESEATISTLFSKKMAV